MFFLRFCGILSEETKLHGHHLIIENLKKNKILRLEINEKVRVKFWCKLKEVHTYRKVKKELKEIGWLWAQTPNLKDNIWEVRRKFSFKCNE